MAIILRCIDINGCIVERFLGVVRVIDTTSPSLKYGVEELYPKHGLSLANVRGQGYDEASNMQRKFNGLKSLILKDCPCAFYVHCFAHQLQLALLGLVKNDRKLAMVFTRINNVTNIIAGSCRKQDMFRNKQINEVVEEICSGDLTNGRGLNQESTLKREGDIRSSYYVTLLSFIRLFNPIIGVLEEIADHTDDHDLTGDKYVDTRRVLRRPEELTNLYHYHFDKFNEILDLQIRELDEQFGEIDKELLLGMSCLDPRHSFRAFDKTKLMKFAKLYPSDFSLVNVIELDWSLATYFEDVSNDDRFLQLDGISGLGKRLIETGKIRSIHLCSNL